MLLDEGYYVTVFDNFMYGMQPLLGCAMNPRLSFIKGDVRDEKEIGRAVKEHDWIFHLAAIVGYPACAADPILATTTNVAGTANIVKAMAKGQRIVFASTGSTYGKVVALATEETPIAPLTLYGKNKSEGEKIVLDSGIDAVILRFATVFGSSPRMRLDLIVNDFVHQALHNRQIVLFEGHFRRTFLHSTDAAKSYLFTIDNFDKMRGGVFNVGDESMNCTKRAVAEKIREYVDYYLHEADVGKDLDARDYEVDYSRIKKLGYRATVSMDEGVRELIKTLSVLNVINPLRNA
jgi:nucleoside-diphosphate-sugar epimerase